MEHVLILCFHGDIVFTKKKTELFSELLISIIMGPAFCIYINLTFSISQSKAALNMLLVFSQYKLHVLQGISPVNFFFGKITFV